MAEVLRPSIIRFLILIKWLKELPCGQMIFLPSWFNSCVWNQSMWVLLWTFHLSKSITTVRLLNEIVVIVAFLSPDFKCMCAHMYSCENVCCCISIFFFLIFSGVFYYTALALLTSSYLDDTWFQLFFVTFGDVVQVLCLVNELLSWLIQRWCWCPIFGSTQVVGYLGCVASKRTCHQVPPSNGKPSKQSGVALSGGE